MPPKMPLPTFASPEKSPPNINHPTKEKRRSQGTSATEELFTLENLSARIIRITNHPAAHALLTKPYRPGWEVPAA